LDANINVTTRIEKYAQFVIPAKAGIQSTVTFLDPTIRRPSRDCFRRDDSVNQLVSVKK